MAGDEECGGFDVYVGRTTEGVAPIPARDASISFPRVPTSYLPEFPLLDLKCLANARASHLFIRLGRPLHPEKCNTYEHGGKSLSVVAP